VAKRCPECGESFPDSARFCDQDGATLQPAGPPAAYPADPAPARPRSHRARFAVVALLIVAGLVSLPFLAERYLRLKVNVVVEKARLQPVSDNGGNSRSQGLLEQLLGLLETQKSWDNVDLNVRLRVHNGTPFQVALASARYAVQAGEHQLVHGVWVPKGGPRAFAPGEDLPIDVIVHPDASSALAIGSELQRGTFPGLRVNGQIAIEILGINFTWPFEVQSIQIDLGPDPSDDESEDPAPVPGTERDTGPKITV
jgi:hypothetical protein